MSPVASVAVAVTKLPLGAAAGRITLKLALPEALVVTVVEPRKLCPSPLPVGSQIAFVKNWTVKVLEAVLLSVP